MNNETCQGSCINFLEKHIEISWTTGGFFNDSDKKKIPTRICTDEDFGQNINNYGLFFVVNI